MSGLFSRQQSVAHSSLDLHAAFISFLHNAVKSRCELAASFPESYFDLLVYRYDMLIKRDNSKNKDLEDHRPDNLQRVEHPFEKCAVLITISQIRLY
jgi:hypothetical protein